jgi:hypothetical protein
MYACIVNGSREFERLWEMYHEEGGVFENITTDFYESSPIFNMDYAKPPGCSFMRAASQNRMSSSSDVCFPLGINSQFLV